MGIRERSDLRVATKSETQGLTDDIPDGYTYPERYIWGFNTERILINAKTRDVPFPSRDLERQTP